MKTTTLLQSSNFAERQLGLVLRAFGYVSTNQPRALVYIGLGKITHNTTHPGGGNAKTRRLWRRFFLRARRFRHASNPENICPSWTAGDYKDER